MMSPFGFLKWKLCAKNSLISTINKKQYGGWKGKFVCALLAQQEGQQINIC